MVKYIKYKGKKLPVRISYSAIKSFMSDTNKNVEDIDVDISLIEPLLFYSLKSGYKAENKEFKFTKDDMEDILDECLNDFLVIIPQFFPNIENTGDVKKN